jgi:hypothetical protein
MNRNKLFSFSFLILSFQCNSSDYLPESISTIYTVAKDHVVGPLDIRQQGNAFIEGLVFEVLNQVTCMALDRDKKFKIIQSARNDALHYCVLPVITLAHCVSISLKMYNKKSTVLLARGVGAFVGAILVQKLVPQE